MTKRIVALLLSALLALSLLGPSYAPGAVPKFKTKITIFQGDASNFHGKVRSKKAACRKHRKVKLQRDDPYTPAGFSTIGSTRSNRKGKWKVLTTPISGDKYRARVLKKKLKHHKGICKARTSRVITAT